MLAGAKFVTGQPASWLQGDFNGDDLFSQLDLVAALQTGNYLQGAYAAIGQPSGSVGGETATGVGDWFALRQVEATQRRSLAPTR